MYIPNNMQVGLLIYKYALDKYVKQKKAKIGPWTRFYLWKKEKNSG